MEEESRNPKRKRGTPARPSTPALRVKVAALVGAGMKQRDIGEQVGISQQAVSDIVVNHVAKEEELQEVVRAARARLGPQAIEIAEKLLHRIRDSADGMDVVVGKDKEGNAVTKRILPPLREQASALREVANVAGLTREVQQFGGGGGGSGMSVHINLKDPETLVAITQALRMLNDVNPASKTIDVTPGSDD